MEIQFQQFGHLILQKTNILYIAEKIVWKSFVNLEHTGNIIDFEKKILPVTKEELKSHQDARNYYTCVKKILKKAR